MIDNIIKKSININNTKYSYILTNIYDFIHFIKNNKNILENIEKLIQKEFCYLINNNINNYFIDKSTYYYQFIFNPSNFEVISFLRLKVNNKSKIGFIDMINTIDSNNNNKNKNKESICKKSMSLLILNMNTNDSKYIQKYKLITNMYNEFLIKCSQNIGFYKKKFIKSNEKYEMEKINF